MVIAAATGNGYEPYPPVSGSTEAGGESEPSGGGCQGHPISRDRICICCQETLVLTPDLSCWDHVLLAVEATCCHPRDATCCNMGRGALCSHGPLGRQGVMADGGAVAE